MDTQTKPFTGRIKDIALLMRAVSITDLVAIRGLLRI